MVRLVKWKWKWRKKKGAYSRPEKEFIQYLGSESCSLWIIYHCLPCLLACLVRQVENLLRNVITSQPSYLDQYYSEYSVQTRAYRLDMTGTVNNWSDV